MEPLGSAATFGLLLAWRLVNAFCVRTFFQPDEYFQALEPAWSIVFGPDSGAWLTWVPSTPCFPLSLSTNMPMETQPPVIARAPS